MFLPIINRCTYEIRTSKWKAKKGGTTYPGIIRSSHRRSSIEKGVLKTFAKFTGKHLCQSLFFNKVADLRPATLSKKRLWHRCFLLNFAKNTYFTENLRETAFGWLKSLCFTFYICIFLVEKLKCFDGQEKRSKFNASLMQVGPLKY